MNKGFVAGLAPKYRVRTNVLFCGTGSQRMRNEGDTSATPIQQCSIFHSNNLLHRRIKQRFSFHHFPFRLRMRAITESRMPVMDNANAIIEIVFIILGFVFCFYFLSSILKLCTKVHIFSHIRKRLNKKLIFLPKSLFIPNICCTFAAHFLCTCAQ